MEEKQLILMRKIREERLNAIDEAIRTKDYQYAIAVAKNGESDEIYDLLILLSEKFVQRATENILKETDKDVLIYLRNSLECMQSVSSENPFFQKCKDAITLVKNLIENLENKIDISPIKKLEALIGLKEIPIQILTETALKEVIKLKINFLAKENLENKAALQYAIDLGKFAQENLSFYEPLFNIAKMLLDYAATSVSRNNEKLAFRWLEYSCLPLKQISLQNPYHNPAQQIIHLIETTQNQKIAELIIDCSRSIYHYELPKNTLKEDISASSYSEDINKIKIFQRAIRSYMRYQTHSLIFGPPKYGQEPIEIPNKYQPGFYNRINDLIEDIAKEEKIINSNKLFHYTSTGNLPTIVISNGLKGNASLREQNVIFIPNVLNERDVEKDDKNVICLAPANVDNDAFSTFGKLSKSKCRVTFKINQPEKNWRIDEFNQFFKLSDFNVFHHSKIYVTKEFSFEVYKSKDIKIKLQLGSYNETVSLTENEYLYYGNTQSINRYCLMQLFTVLNKLTITSLQERLFNYLEAQSDSELRKILIAFAQGITLYAEYNFNGFLPLDLVSIEEILILGDERIKFDFSGLDREEYKEAMNLLGEGKFNEMQRWKKRVEEKETILQKENSLYVFGHLFGDKRQKRVTDLRDVPSTIFDADKNYVETRWGVTPLKSDTYSELTGTTYFQKK